MPADAQDLFRDRRRAESFGAVAEQYDRARPSYPDALVVDLLMHDPHDVLDVGCGTGKAARLFAARGLRVLGVEVDAGMAAVARGHGIEVEVSGFESWDDRGDRFDLLISGQAWHWVDPDVGARRAAQVLRPGGVVALFWSMDDVLEDAHQALDAVYGQLVPHLLEARRARVGRGHGPAVDGLRAAGFRDVATRDYPWQRVYTRDEWLDLLSTYSDHHLLPGEQRNALLAGLGRAIDDLGGTVTARYETHLIEARKPR